MQQAQNVSNLSRKKIHGSYKFVQLLHFKITSWYLTLFQPSFFSLTSQLALKFYWFKMGFRWLHLPTWCSGTSVPCLSMCYWSLWGGLFLAVRTAGPPNQSRLTCWIDPLSSVDLKMNRYMRGATDRKQNKLTSLFCSSTSVGFFFLAATFIRRIVH